MVYKLGRMKFGIFLAPFHRVGESPTLALERDMQLVEHPDALDYDEAWTGEHHSAARELIAEPMIFIAMAAARTSGPARRRRTRATSYWRATSLPTSRASSSRSRTTAPSSRATCARSSTSRRTRR